MNIDNIFSIEPFGWSCIFASFFCGALIGLERQLRGKPVGIRTSSLIVLGTYFFVTAAMLVNNDMSDPSRIKILEALSSDKEFCVTDISKKTDVTLSATSHQLSKLELMGIVKKCRYGQNICYCLNRKNNLNKKIIRILKLIN